MVWILISVVIMIYWYLFMDHSTDILTFYIKSINTNSFIIFIIHILFKCFISNISRLLIHYSYLSMDSSADIWIFHLKLSYIFIFHFPTVQTRPRTPYGALPDEFIIHFMFPEFCLHWLHSIILICVYFSVSCLKNEQSLSEPNMNKSVYNDQTFLLYL